MDNTETKDFIEKAWDNIADLNINDKALIEHVNNTIDLVDNGTIRVAEKQGNDWTVNQWIKKAVLLSFRINSNQLIKGPYTTWYDKVEGKTTKWGDDDWKVAGYRHVPNGVVRKGSFIGKNVVLMPSFVNIGAYVDEGTICLLYTSPSPRDSV